MPLEFALRPRFDLKRPAPRRRLAWLRLHPLLVPVGVYWLSAAGLTYGFIRSAAVNEADAAEPESGFPESWSADPAPLEAAVPSPLSTRNAPVDSGREPSEPEPAPAAFPEPPRDAPLFRREPDAAPRAAAPTPEPAPLRTPPPAVEDEDRVALDSFEPARTEVPAPPRPAPAQLPRDLEPEPGPARAARTDSLPSCESASATANQTIEVGSPRGAPDLTRGAFASVLEHGAYLTPCSIPPRMAVDICAAVQNGNVVGVTVTTAPRDALISACVRRAVTRLRFPRSPQLDVTRTRFDRER